MATFKTPKGTELPFTLIKSKEYLLVPYRIIWFKEEKPDWYIKTSFTLLNEKTAICHAEIYDEQNRFRGDGDKREDSSHFPDFMEKAQTGAIGRALAFIGYGTQFAQELDSDSSDGTKDGHKIVDSPLEPKESHKNEPITQQWIDYRMSLFSGQLSDANYKVLFGKFKGKTFGEIGPNDLWDYAEYILDATNKKKEKLKPQTIDFIEKVKGFCERKFPLDDERNPMFEEFK